MINFPDKPGWYFGKRRREGAQMECLFVSETEIEIQAVRTGSVPMAEYDWFGRVPMPVEMGSYNSGAKER